MRQGAAEVNLIRKMTGYGTGEGTPSPRPRATSHLLSLGRRVRHFHAQCFESLRVGRRIMTGDRLFETTELDQHHGFIHAQLIRLS
jgi:hypothetical protein